MTDKNKLAIIPHSVLLQIDEHVREGLESDNIENKNFALNGIAEALNKMTDIRKNQNKRGGIILPPGKVGSEINSALDELSKRAGKLNRKIKKRVGRS